MNCVEVLIVAICCCFVVCPAKKFLFCKKDGWRALIFGTFQHRKCNRVAVLMSRFLLSTEAASSVFKTNLVFLLCTLLLGLAASQ